MRTGQSETGLKACTYEIRILADDSSHDEGVWVATPQGGSGWQLVELRPVSEGVRYSEVYRRQTVTPPPRFR